MRGFVGQGPPAHDCGITAPVASTALPRLAEASDTVTPKAVKVGTCSPPLMTCDGQHGGRGVAAHEVLPVSGALHFQALGVAGGSGP